MKKHATLALGAITAIAALGAGRPALAGVSIQTLTPTMNTTYVLTEDAMMEAAPRDARAASGMRPYLGIQYNFVNDPLVALSPDRTQQTDVVVDSINTLDVSAGAYLLPNLAAGVNLPMDLVHNTAQAREFGIGDMTIEGKYQLLPREEIVALSLIPELFLPTGSRDLLLSNTTVGAGLLVALERDFGPVRVAANLGYRYTPGAQYLDIDYRNQLPLALGVYCPLPGGFGVNAEASGALSLPLDHYNNPGQVYVGGRYQFVRDAEVSAGAAIGSVGGNGAGDVRAIVGVKFTPDFSSASSAVARVRSRGYARARR